MDFVTHSNCVTAGLILLLTSLIDGAANAIYIKERDRKEKLIQSKLNCSINENFKIEFIYYRNDCGKQYEFHDD